MIAMMEIILILESELELGGIGVGFIGSDLSPFAVFACTNWLV